MTNVSFWDKNNPQVFKNHADKLDMSNPKLKVVKKMNCGSILKNEADQFFHRDEDDVNSKPYPSKQEAVDGYYVKQAYDHLGNAIRDNSLEEKISIGKQIDNGTWED